MSSTDPSPDLALPGGEEDHERLAKLWQLAYRESEQRFYQLADAAPALIWMADASGARTFFNKRWLAFTGTRLEQQLDAGWLAWVHVEDRADCLAAYQEAFARHEEFNICYRLRRHDGSYRCLLDHGVPRFDAADTFLGYIGCCVDSTEMLETERRLDEQLRFEQLLSDMALALTNCPLTRMDTEIERWLRHIADFLRMEAGFIAQLSEDRKLLSSINVADFGKSRRYTLMPISKVPWLMEILRQREVTVLTSRSAHPASMSLDAYDQLWFFMRRGIMESLNFKSVRVRPFRPPQNSESHTVDQSVPLHARTRAELARGEISLFRSLVLIPLFVADTELGILAAGSHSEHNWSDALTQRFRLIGAILSAALERKRKELALSHAEAEKAGHREMLAHIGRVHILGEMATSIAHELNQPLAAISNYAAAALSWLQNGARDNDRLAELLTKINEQSLRAGSVLHKLRTLIKKSSAEARICDINEVIRDIATLMEIDARIQGCSIEMRLTPSLPMVRIDPIQIQQVILNLVRNGLDAIQQCRRQPQPAILIATTEENGRIKISVADSGIGISKAEPAQIFQPFYSTKNSGMGMGLSICQKIINAHDGNIAFSDNPGGGTVFYFYLPASRAI